MVTFSKSFQNSLNKNVDIEISKQKTTFLVVHFMAVLQLYEGTATGYNR